MKDFIPVKKLNEMLCLMGSLYESSMWSCANFPLEKSSNQFLKHAVEELDEVIAADNLADKRKEYADLLMCVFGAIEKDGISLEVLAKEINEKLAINKVSEWVFVPEKGFYKRVK